MRDLNSLRICAILHDIGKLECWANRKPWSEHIYYSFNMIKETLGEEYAYTSMRHHTGPSYDAEYHPETEDEKIISLADNLASGADRREEPEKGAVLPKAPVELTHILSDGSKVLVETDKARLAYTAQEIKAKLKELSVGIGKKPGEVYQKIYDCLEGSHLRIIPADTRRPINDVSLWHHLKLTSAFAACIGLDGGYRGDDLEKYRFGLLSGDADKVSNFVSTSSRLPDLRARSERIKQATKSAASTITAVLGPECLIYAGGGGFLALSPPKIIENVASEAKAAFEKATSSEVTITVSHVIEHGRKMQREFGEVWREASRQMELKKLERAELPGEAKPLESGVEVCDICHVRAATHEDASKTLPIDALPRPEALCDACWWLREEGRKYGPKVELDAIGKDLVAVLKADGDDMGRVLRGERFEKYGKSTTPSRLSALSSLIHRVCEVQLSKCVEAYGGLCVFSGGDDVLAVLPGEKALEAARSIASEFKNATAGACTMSMGVAIFPRRLPIYVGLEAAQDLLSAKAKRSEGKAAVAFAIIGGSGIPRGTLEKRVRAYKWSELDELLHLAEYLGRSGLPMSQIRRIAEATKMDPRKAEILIKYLMGRRVIPWREGEKLISYLNSGFLYDAFLVYNAFRLGRQ